MSVSVAGCFPADMNSRKAEGVVLSTSRDARLTVWSGSIDCIITLSRSVTTSMSFPCLTTIGVLILAFSLSSCSHPSLKSPYTCELKIVTGLPWEVFNF